LSHFDNDFKSIIGNNDLIVSVGWTMKIVWIVHKNRKHVDGSIDAYAPLPVYGWWLVVGGC